MKKILLIFTLLQITLWFKFKDLKPEMEILPTPFSENGLKALSLGDEQFYFRYLLFKLQNYGDTFGRFTALKNYDYAKLEDHFTQLDLLDNQSHYVPYIAAYYFSQSQNKEDVNFIVNYLEKRYDGDNQHNWWWLSQATYLANHKLNNKELALRLATKLANSGLDIPIWAKQMPAFIHSKIGQKKEAYFIIKNIIEDVKSGKLQLKQTEMNFMQFFIEKTLEELKGGKIDE